MCPLYSGPVNVAMTEEEEEEYGRQLNVDDQNLVNVDGTKLKLSVKLIKVLLLSLPKVSKIHKFCIFLVITFSSPGFVAC